MALLVTIASEAVPAEKLVKMIADSGVLLPMKLRKRIARCQAAPPMLRPDVSSLGFLIGAMSLNRSLSQLVFDEDVLVTALARAFPGQRESLRGHLREEAAQLEKMLSQSCDAIEKNMQLKAGLDSYQDLGELVALHSAEGLLAEAEALMAQARIAKKRRPLSSSTSRSVSE